MDNMEETNMLEIEADPTTSNPAQLKIGTLAKDQTSLALSKRLSLHR